MTLAGFRNALINVWIFFDMWRIKFFLWDPFIRKTHRPQKIQDQLLQKIIGKNQDTQFGRAHGFDTIHSYQSFCDAVPVHTYEDLRTYIESQENGNEPALNAEQPIMYSQTSGTTGKPKYIPVLPSTLSQYKVSQALFAWAQFSGAPGIYQGKVLAIGSPTTEGYLATGTPYGSMSGLILESMPTPVKLKFVVPFEVFAITDYRLKYLLIAAFSLREPNISLLASANPSTFLKLMDVIQENYEILVKFIATADPNGLEGEPGLLEIIKEIPFQPDRPRARQLKQFLGRQKTLTYRDLWPHLRTVSTWTSGSCGVLLPRLKPLLPDPVQIIEMGYLASEFRGSLTVDAVNNRCVPTFHENFFEFVEREHWEDQKKNFIRLEQVEEGKQYYLFVTTQNGLYRYFINDIIEIGSPFNNTPTLRFIQKGKGITNLTGEKLSESQALESLEILGRDLKLDWDFFVLLADQERLQYTLYLELLPQTGLAEKLDEQLSIQNIEFREKLKSGRLKPTRVIFLKPGSEDAYRKYYIDRGQREGQFKVVRLQYTKDCSFDFSLWEHPQP